MYENTVTVMTDGQDKHLKCRCCQLLQYVDVLNVTMNVSSLTAVFLHTMWQLLPKAVVFCKEKLSSSSSSRDSCWPKLSSSSPPLPPQLFAHGARYPCHFQAPIVNWQVIDVCYGQIIISPPPPPPSSAEDLQKEIRRLSTHRRISWQPRWRRPSWI